MRALALASVLALAAPARGASPADDPQRTHYLFAPSAFLLRGGELVVGQSELVMTSIAVGVGDNVTLVTGSAMPTLYALTRASLPNLQLELKAGFSPAEIVHLAVGIDSVTLPALMGGYGYAVVSLGRPSLHVTLGVGLPYLTAVRGGPSGTGPPLLLAAGAIGLGRHVLLATENWFFPGRPDLPTVNAGVVRLLVWRLSVGLGAARVSDVHVPLPWLDLGVRIFG